MTRSGIGVAAYLTIAFGLSWAIWEIPLQLGNSIRSRPFLVAVFVGSFAPAVAAFVVRKWITREGFGDAGLGILPRAWPYYLAAIAIPLVITTGVGFAAPLVGVAHPDIRAVALIVPPAFRQTGAVAGLLPVLLFLIAGSVLATPVLFGEEFGWRSYLQIRVFPRRPLAAAVVTGVIWGVWHYPLLLAGTELPEHPLAILFLFPLGTVLFAIIFGWLRAKSGSVWVTSLIHSGMNNVRSPLLAALFAGVSDKLELTLVGFGIVGALAAIVLLIGGMRTDDAGAM